MVMDVAGPNFPWDNVEGDARNKSPNDGAKEFYQLLKDADTPLFEGCSTQTTLSTVTELLTIKSESNMTVATFDRMLDLHRSMLPPDNRLPKDFYHTKKMVRKLGLGYKTYAVCQNNCFLYYGEEAEKLRNCPVCNHPRFKEKKRKSKQEANVPFKVLRYFPIIPRLQRLYMSENTSKHMIWHATVTEIAGVMDHPVDGEAWKSFSVKHPEFASEPRNLRLGLAMDRFCPFGTKKYSCWPVFITPYNLPPEMCMKEPFIFLTMMIPGPTSPSKDLNVYLRPLIDDLMKLWKDGVLTWDNYRKTNFNMRAALMWTISDFPAYGMLSGWSTHGKLACPVCLNDVNSFWLKHDGKPCWFDCHRRYTEGNHPYRRDKNGITKNTIEYSRPPRRLSSEGEHELVCKFEQLTSGAGREKLNGFGQTHNWFARTIFWELPYWRTLLIRHNLDVMHCEKNFFSNLFATIMNGTKTKDSLKAREDLKVICNRPNLHLQPLDNGRVKKPKAVYVLSEEQRKDVCQWVSQLKLPDGYASNIAKCVIGDSKISDMKSHDCHIFMERLLPHAIRDMFPDNIFGTLVELSHFFRDLCSTKLRIEHCELMEKNIVTILCKLERIFPPAFFDVMEHLAIHLPYEAKIGGPVHYRWMYPFKRQMFQLKRKCRSKRYVEGSLCEAYHVLEISSFSSEYFDVGVPTRRNQMTRNVVPQYHQNPRLEVWGIPYRTFNGSLEYLSKEDRTKAHIYVLLNLQEMLPYLSKFEEEVTVAHPTLTNTELGQLLADRFSGWLKNRLANEPSSDEDSEVYMLLRVIASAPPSFGAKHYGGCYINGYKWHTTSFGAQKATMNNGVCVRGEYYCPNTVDWYGTLEEIIELNYFGLPLPILMFKCQWYDPVRGVEVDKKHGFVDIKSKSLRWDDDQFIFAYQAQQVYYDPKLNRMRKKGSSDISVIKTSARSTFTVRGLEVEDNVHDDDLDIYQEETIHLPIDVNVDDAIETPLELRDDETLDEVVHLRRKRSRGETSRSVEIVEEEGGGDDDDDDDDDDDEEEEDISSIDVSNSNDDSE